MKVTSLIPNGLSTLNLIFGLLSILSSINWQFTNAAFFLLFGMFADAFDGKIARKFNAVSDIGKEFDSLADLVNFGVAGSLLIYLKYLTHMQYGIIIPVLGLVCTALRLARFNIDPNPAYFTGIPSPAYGFFAAAFVLSGIQLQTHTVAFLAAVLSLLMVSTIKYPTFKTVSKKFWIIVGVLLAIALLLTYLDVRFILLPLVLYGILGPVIYIWLDRRAMKKQFLG